MHTPWAPHRRRARIAVRQGETRGGRSGEAGAIGPGEFEWATRHPSRQHVRDAARLAGPGAVPGGDPQPPQRVTVQARRDRGVGAQGCEEVLQALGRHPGQADPGEEAEAEGAGALRDQLAVRGGRRRRGEETVRVPLLPGYPQVRRGGAEVPAPAPRGREAGRGQVEEALGVSAPNRRRRRRAPRRVRGMGPVAHR